MVYRILEMEKNVEKDLLLAVIGNEMKSMLRLDIICKCSYSNRGLLETNYKWVKRAPEIGLNLTRSHDLMHEQCSLSPA